MSKNDSLSYLFRFNEPDPYTESVLRKSIDNINNSAANNMSQAYFLNGTKRKIILQKKNHRLAQT